MGYWAEVAETFEARTPESRAAHESAREHIPLGVASSAREFDPHPFVVDRAEGPYLHDVDGNRYIDFDMNNGAGMTGHAHPAIVEALQDQVERGTLYTMPHRLLEEAAVELKRRWPAAEKVRFANSGTEGTMHAIRLARAYAGRDKVVKMEGAYHGVNDYVMVSAGPPKGKVGHPTWPHKVAEGGGIPQGTLDTVEVAPYNDLEAVEDLFREHLNEVGALIVEPVMLNKAVTPPREDYLQGLRELCDEYGVVYIFDEVKTGVKVAPGGAAELYGVEPDLVVMAKSIGGETPVAAFGGRAEIMDQIEDGAAQHYGTYNGNPLVLRALVTTLRDVLTEDAYDHVERLGDRMARGYEEILADSGITGRVEAVNAQGMLMFTDEPVYDYRDFVAAIDDDFHRLFWFGLVNQGVIPHPYGARQQWTISVQHEAEHVDAAHEAFKEIAPRLAGEQ